MRSSSGRRRGRRLLLLLALLVLPPVPAGAQDVRFTPRPDRTDERELARFLQEADYRLWPDDTVVARADTVTGSVLVLEATARISGRVKGDVYVVNGDLFLRPDARVEGDILVLGGGYYASSLAVTTGRVTYRPNLLLRVMPSDGGYQIYQVERAPDVLSLHGLYGFHVPLYNRVDGWRFGWGGRVRATGVAGQPELEAVARYALEREAVEATVRHRWHPVGDVRLTLEAERAVRSNEEWIRGDLSNTLSYLFGAGDFRNYYLAEAVALSIGRPASRGWGGSVTLAREEAESLEAAPLAVFFSDDSAVRPNPGVDGGTVWSAGASVSYRQRGPRSRLYARVRAEASDSAVAGDFSFLLGEARLAWRRPGLGAHTVEIFGIARGGLAGTLPRRRWSAMGGRATLPTLETLQLRGERLLFGQVSYLVPVAPLSLDPLGTPEVFLRTAVGSVWSEGGSPAFTNNVVAGLRFLFLEAALAVDPTEGELDGQFLLGGAFPSRFWR